MKIWTCKIGEVGKVPAFADTPMRQAVREAYFKLTGQHANFLFSGWDGQLTKTERELVPGRREKP